MTMFFEELLLETVEDEGQEGNEENEQICR